jgi:hypothetical protein
MKHMSVWDAQKHNFFGIWFPICVHCTLDQKDATVFMFSSIKRREAMYVAHNLKLRGVRVTIIAGEKQ